MSYISTTWANGDTITAAKLNNMESGIEDAQNGWEVTSSTTTYINNESVTTTDNGEGSAAGALSYSNAISDSTITVVFDGTTYTCARGSFGYGAIAESPVPDFTDYPFGLAPMGPVLLITESAGTHTLSVSVSSSSVTTTEDFRTAVESIDTVNNGWSIENTQLFSETVTTASGDFGYQATLAYATELTASTLIITFDGTEYTCAQQSIGSIVLYGAADPSDFSEYPFTVLCQGTTNSVITEAAGTYTISATTDGVTTTADFQAAVNSVVGTVTPMECVSGTTTQNQIDAAIAAGRLMYFIYDRRCYCIIVSYDIRGISYISDGSVTVTATIVDGVFTVTEE